MQFLIGYNSVQLTQRTGAGSFSTDVEGSKTRLQRFGLRQRVQSGAVHDPLVANFTMIGCGNSRAAARRRLGLMLRRGTGGTMSTVSSLASVRGVAIRDPETYLAPASSATPDLATSDLIVRNITSPRRRRCSSRTRRRRQPVLARPHRQRPHVGHDHACRSSPRCRHGHCSERRRGLRLVAATGSPIGAGHGTSPKDLAKAGTFVVQPPTSAPSVPANEVVTGWTAYAGTMCELEVCRHLRRSEGSDFSVG